MVNERVTNEFYLKISQSFVIHTWSPFQFFIVLIKLFSLYAQYRRLSIKATHEIWLLCVYILDAKFPLREVHTFSEDSNPLPAGIFVFVREVKNWISQYQYIYTSEAIFYIHD